MNTPIYDFVNAYADRNGLRLHMPGHKGKNLLGMEALDITEIKGADSLFEADGIIAESERNAAALFGTKATLFSTEGSSHAIRAMIWLVKLYALARGEKPRIAACRNAHKTFVTATALLDVTVEYPDACTNGSYLSLSLSTHQIEAYLREHKPTALYITSPDYSGNVADISAIAALCHAHGVLLLVDNAHGAYLRFLTPSRHPMDLGADLCCDSAHKTLPALTGGAYLHIAQKSPDFFVQNAKTALSLFGSTSPSYLVLQSLDLVNAYLADSYREKLGAFTKKLDALKARLVQKGFTLWGSEPLKLTIFARDFGYSGNEIAEHLRKWEIECEFSDPDILVLMFTPELADTALTQVENALTSLEKRERLPLFAPPIALCAKAMPPHLAISLPSERISATNALGRILACPTVGCPPAVPIVMCGERIDQNAIEVFGYYGIDTVMVVKEMEEIR